MHARLLTILLAVLAGVMPAHAQTALGSVRGAVTDEGHGAMAEAELVLVHEETSARRETRSAPDGTYAFAALAPGAYRLEVAHGSYRRHVERFVLAVNQALQLDVRLQLGTLTETIDVTAPAIALRRDSPALTTTIDERLIAALPLDGRNFLELALLVPGVSPPPQGSANSVRNTAALSANGAREDANAYILDGIANVDPTLNNAGVRPAVDAIREFEVQTSTADASFGGAAGAQINIVTRAGTNRPSGAIYDFLRNGALDARNAFAPAGEPAPDYRRNQFGAAGGGPIRRDRTFVFADYEGTRATEGITRVTNVPTARERAGDFSQSLFARPTIPGVGVPFPGDAIPAVLQNPVGSAIANLYPLPNRGVAFQNYVSSPNRTDDADQFDLRIDEQLRPSTRLTARYSFADRRLYEPFSGPAFPSIPGFGTFIDTRAQNLAAGATAVVSPTLVNEVRAGFTRTAGRTEHENRGRSLNTAVGLPELSDNPRDFGLSYITISGFSPLGDEYNNPQQSTITTFQVNDTLTWTRGRHLVKAGLDTRLVRQDAFRDVQSRGFLTFSDRVPLTGNALADLLLGYPALTGGARLDNPQHLRSWSLALFVQDHWRVGRDLTVSAGLRYDYTAPPVDAQDRAAVYDPLTRSLTPVGTNGLPRSGFDADRNDLGPRVGAAWAPGGSESTIVRGAYGLVYSRASLAPFEGLYFSPPYFELSYYYSLPGLPLTVSDPFPAFFPVGTPPSALAFQRDLKTPFLHQFNVGVQRLLGRSRAVEVAYVGSRGRNLLAGRDFNQPAASPQPLNLRPDPRFADILILESRARSTYDALQVRFEQRSTGGLSVLGAYTFGKAQDDASSWFPSAGDPNFPQDSNDPGAEYGRAGFDVRHRLAVSLAYDLPLARNAPAGSLSSWLLADWQITGILVAQSGRPFTVALLPELDNSNTGRSNLGFGANDRPNVAGDPALADPSPARWFDTAAFSLPPYGTFGNSGRNVLDGPGYRSVNLAIAKSLRFGARTRLQVRAEAYNVFNRVNYDQPDIYFGSPTFGQILSAQAPRRIQFGARVAF